MTNDYEMYGELKAGRQSGSVLQPAMSASAPAVRCSAVSAAAAEIAISERAARLSAVGNAAISREYATSSCERIQLHMIPTRAP